MTSDRARCVVYVDIDVTRTPLYNYRSPHMQAARRLGYVPIVIAESCNPHLDAIRADCDVLVPVQSLTFSCSGSEVVPVFRPFCSLVKVDPSFMSGC